MATNTKKHSYILVLGAIGLFGVIACVLTGELKSALGIFFLYGFLILVLNRNPETGSQVENVKDGEISGPLFEIKSSPTLEKLLKEHKEACQNAAAHQPPDERVLTIKNLRMELAEKLDLTKELFSLRSKFTYRFDDFKVELNSNNSIDVTFDRVCAGSNSDKRLVDDSIPYVYRRSESDFRLISFGKDENQFHLVIDENRYNSPSAVFDLHCYLVEVYDRYFLDLVFRGKCHFRTHEPTRHQLANWSEADFYGGSGSWTDYWESEILTFKSVDWILPLHAALKECSQLYEISNINFEGVKKLEALKADEKNFMGSAS